MKATIVDLRYKMKDVIKALERREKIEILYHGKVKGIILPPVSGPGVKLKNHPFFGINRTEKKTVSQEMDELRGLRHDAL